VFETSIKMKEGIHQSF